MAVPPAATPALWKASTAAASAAAKPMVPPLAWQAGAPSIGLPTAKAPRAVRHQ